MDTIEDIIEQEIAEPLIDHSTQAHQRNLRHHHNGSVLMVNTQTGQMLQHQQRHEMNNNGEFGSLKSNF